MDNTQFLKIMFVGVFAGALLGNMLYCLIKTFNKNDSNNDDVKDDVKEIVMSEKNTFKTIQKFNWSNTVAIKINYNIKKQLREIYIRFGFDNEQICRLELEYDNESYKIVPILQQGIFKGRKTIDIAEETFKQMQESKLMVLLPEEIKRIIDENINN